MPGKWCNAQSQKSAIFYFKHAFKIQKQNPKNTQMVLYPQVAGWIGNFNAFISFTAAGLSWSLY